MDLAIDIDGWPASHDWAGLAVRAAEATGRVAAELANPRLSADVLFTRDADVHTLNCEWRAKDKPTNVLSFPMLAREDLLGLALEGGPEMLGDLALAWETCSREALKKGVPLEHHAGHLLVHGLLHLAGYDHETSAEAAEMMERLEIEALALMGIENPYKAADSEE